MWRILELNRKKKRKMIEILIANEFEKIIIETCEYKSTVKRDY
jgi:phosphoglucomutase